MAMEHCAGENEYFQIPKNKRKYIEISKGEENNSLLVKSMKFLHGYFFFLWLFNVMYFAISCLPSHKVRTISIPKLTI